jgi:hypothetical protein
MSARSRKPDTESFGIESNSVRRLCVIHRNGKYRVSSAASTLKPQIV